MSTARRGRPTGLPIAVRRGPLSRAWGRSGRSPEPRNEPRHRAGPRAARWSAPRFSRAPSANFPPVSVVRAPPVASRAAPQPMIWPSSVRTPYGVRARWCSVTRMRTSAVGCACVTATGTSWGPGTLGTRWQRIGHEREAMCAASDRVEAEPAVAEFAPTERPHQARGPHCPALYPRHPRCRSD